MERGNVIIFAVLFVAIGLCGFAFGAAYEQARHQGVYHKPKEVYAKEVIESLDSALVRTKRINATIDRIIAREDSINAIINEMINQ